jgi:transcription antitermination factor NusG
MSISESLDRDTRWWTVVRPAPRCEQLATESVRVAGFEAFIPKLAGARGTVWLFSGYFFVRSLNGVTWQTLKRTPGVGQVVMVGDQPARCPDHEIDRLRARCDADGIVRLPPPQLRHACAAGDPVRIVAGPLSGLSAIHSGMSAAQREIVLIAILGGARKVAVPRAFVSPR